MYIVQAPLFDFEAFIQEKGNKNLVIVLEALDAEKLLTTRERDGSYMAQIINWPVMIGHGETRKKALERLKENFCRYRDNNQNIPRPSTKVPVQWGFASTVQISKYQDIEEDFFRRVLSEHILGILFSSDESSLRKYEPFDTELAKKQRQEIIKRTYSIYGVDISDVYDGPLYRVFELSRYPRAKPVALYKSSFA